MRHALIDAPAPLDELVGGLGWRADTFVTVILTGGKALDRCGGCAVWGRALLAGLGRKRDVCLRPTIDHSGHMRETYATSKLLNSLTSRRIA